MIMTDRKIEKNNQHPQNRKKRYLVLKIMKWIICAILLLTLLLAGGIYYYYNYGAWRNVVRDLVHTYGSAATGTEVNVGAINLSLRNGEGTVGNITVANPHEYSQDHIIKLGNISVVVDKNSILDAIKNATNKQIKTQTIVINEVHIDKPEVIYEFMNLNRNNVNDVTANLNKNSAAAKKTAKSADDNSKEYKVVIKKVLITNGTATVAANMLGVSQSLSLNLPTITIANLGTEKQGITIEEGIIRVFQEILKTTANIVSKADLKGLLGGVADLTEAAASGVSKVAGAATSGVTDSAKSLTNSIGGLFK